MADDAGKKYVIERHIPELFQSLTLGLIHHRPDDAVQFLVDCVDRLRDVGADRVMWDTFLSPGNRLTPAATSLRGVLPPIPAPTLDPATETKQGSVSERRRDKLNKLYGCITDPRRPDSNWGGGPSGGRGERRGWDRGGGKGRGGNQGGGDIERQSGGDHCSTEPQLHPRIQQRADSDPHQGDPHPSTTHPHTAPTNSRHHPTDQQPPPSDPHTSPAAPPPTAAGLIQAGVLRGRMDQLPTLPSTTVRIFLSSTFSDFKAERNILPRQAYPQIQKFCSDNGLDFQVVDMRWSVTDDVINDHQVSDLCIREIAKCQQVSCEPNFVALVGDRYGYRPFPACIPANEFEAVSAGAAAALHPGAATLHQWFLLDTNNVPPTYLLQPITAAGGADHWAEVSALIQGALRVGARHAHQQGALSEQAAEEYFISVTEQEIQRGILKIPDASSKSFSIHRHLVGVDETDSGHVIGKFIDLKEGGVDGEAQQYLNQLVKDKLNPALQPDKMHRFQIQWKGKPLEEATNDELEQYLKDFSATFVSEIIGLISKNLAAENEDCVAQDVFHEVLHHLTFAQTKCDMFCGRQDTLHVIKNYLVSPSQTGMPLFLHACSGYGKTAVMSKVAQLLPSWLGEEVHLVIRFMGTSPSSSGILNTLKSIIAQLCLLYEWVVPNDEKLTKMGDVRRYLWSLFDRVHSQKPHIPLVLILDAVDQLTETNGAHSLLWLPRSLPCNVFMLVSMLSDRYTCLQNAKRRFPDEAAYHRLPYLSHSNCEEIVGSYLKRKHWNLTPDQAELVTNTVKNCAQPLYLKLVMDDAVKWHSYNDVSEVQIATTVHGAIAKLFWGLEVSYGHVFVSHSLGYLTCGRVGLTSIEMEDVLSCDDAVLSEVYQYHDPPVTGIIRIPSLMWTRLHNNLDEYLAERKVDGKTVVAWYHRQFWEEAQKRYIVSQRDRHMFHRRLAELYDQDTGIQRSVVLHLRNGKVWKEADRNVMPQPLNIRNVRKLNSLPYHLLHSDQIEALKSKYLMNFIFLYTKLRAVGVSDLISDIEALLADERLQHDTEVQRTCDLIQVCYDTLRMDPSLFAFNVVDRLHNYSNISKLGKHLMEDASMWLQKTDKPLILPAHNVMFAGMESALKFSMIGGQKGVLSNKEKYLVSNWADFGKHKVNVIKFSEKDIVTSADVPNATPVAVSEKEEEFFYIEGEHLVIRETETGGLIQKVKYTTNDYEHITPICMTLDGALLVLAVKLGRPQGLEAESTWRSESLIVLLELQESHNTGHSYHRQAVLRSSTNYVSKKPIENAVFVQLDGLKKLVALGRERIFVYSVPDLEQECEFKFNEDVIYGLYVSVLPDQSSMVIGSCGSKGARVQLLNYKDSTVTASERVHHHTGETMYVYGIAARNPSDIIMGVTSEGEKRDKSLYRWNSITDVATTINTGAGVWKLPERLEVNKCWTYAFIAWKNGDISLVDLSQNMEVLSFQAHFSAVWMAQLFDNDRQLLTTSRDQTIKVWEVGKLIENIDNTTNLPSEEQAMVDGIDVVVSKSQETRSTELTAVDRSPFLCPKEQCLSVNITGSYVMTASPQMSEAPKFWHIEDGTQALDITARHFKAYTESLDKLKFNKSSRTHATIQVYGDIIIYTRKRRNAQAICVIQGLDEPRVIGHDYYTETFFSLCPPSAMLQSYAPESPGRVVFLVEDGMLEVRDLTLNSIDSIELPLLSDELGNIGGNMAKKKLMMMRVGMSYDGKWFFFLNPVAKPKTYIDLVDLEEKAYSHRATVNTYWRYNVLEETFFFLAKHREGEDLDIFHPRKIIGKEEDFEYRSLIFQATTMVSEDSTLGLELLQENKVRIWQVEPLARLHILVGHVSEITSARFSRDKRLVVTGSYDHTVRVWEVGTGKQLCMFCVYGAVEAALFTPSASHVIVHCYSAPQMKRAAVLKVLNINQTQTNKEEKAEQ